MHLHLIFGSTTAQAIIADDHVDAASISRWEDEGGATAPDRYDLIPPLRPQSLAQAMLPPKTILRVSSADWQRVLKEGGCTIDSRTGRLARPDDVWAVSLAGAGVRLKRSLLPADLEAYARDHIGAILSADGLYLGVWFDERAGEYCLDLTVLIRSRREAMAFARANGQVAIFNLLTRESVWFSTEESPPEEILPCAIAA